MRIGLWNAVPEIDGLVKLAYETTPRLPGWWKIDYRLWEGGFLNSLMEFAFSQFQGMVVPRYHLISYVYIQKPTDRDISFPFWPMGDAAYLWLCLEPGSDAIKLQTYRDSPEQVYSMIPKRGSFFVGTKNEALAVIHAPTEADRIFIAVTMVDPERYEQVMAEEIED